MSTASQHASLLPPGILDALRRINSPTVSNAIETFGIRPRDAGVSLHAVQCMFPEHGALVGYACTATIMSGQPAGPNRRVNRRDYWEYLAAAPDPRVIVMQDLTDPPAGAYWGEVNTNIHRALGCVGLVTNGSVRDLDEVQPQNFPMFAACVTVSHAFAHLEDFGRPVKIGNLLVNSGDIIHADKHGVVLIPAEIAAEIPAAAVRVEQRERVIIDLCRSPQFSIDALDKLVAESY